MTKYESIETGNPGEDHPLVSDHNLIDDRNSSSKRYFVGGIIALCFLAVGLHCRHFGAAAPLENTQSLVLGAAPKLNDFCNPNSEVDTCGADLVCCPKTKKYFYLIGMAGSCQSCCSQQDCAGKIDQPPAGEFGEPFCINNQCRAFVGEKSQVPEDGYPVYTPSETEDNSKKYRKYVVPRKVFSDEPGTPVMETLWHFDFNEQDENFSIRDIVCNGTHITIPSFEKLHAGYSKSYTPFDEHETGIVTMVIMDNKYSVVADYPKLAFVEKYHTLTFHGQKDKERGKYMKDLSAKQMEAKPKWNTFLGCRINLYLWFLHARTLTYAMFHRSGGTMNQVQAGLDLALNWQIRRFVNSYTDDGALNPTTSSSWASHSKKAQKAIKLAKDPSFKREHLKSEQHCKHLEAGQGFTVDHTKDTITMPLGRPITTFSGEIVSAPTYYLGLNTGTLTAHYDADENILQLFFQGYAASRQYPDVKFPGPPGFAGLYLSRVAEGSNYDIDPLKDGRGDVYVHLEAPKDHRTGRFRTSTPDVTLWRRPLEERCEQRTVDDPFWEGVDIEKNDNSIYDMIVQQKHTFAGVIRGIACTTTWMRQDFGDGSNSFGPNELGGWVHFLGEVRDDHTKEMGLAKYWDEWECFYQGKDPASCH